MSDYVDKKIEKILKHHQLVPESTDGGIRVDKNAIENLVAELISDPEIASAIREKEAQFDQDLRLNWHDRFVRRCASFYDYIPAVVEYKLLESETKASNIRKLALKTRKFAKHLSIDEISAAISDLHFSFGSLYQALSHYYYGSKYFYWEDENCPIHSGMTKALGANAIFKYSDPNVFTTSNGRYWQNRPNWFPTGFPGELEVGCRCLMSIAHAYEPDDKEHWAAVDKAEQDRMEAIRKSKQEREVANRFFKFYGDYLHHFGQTKKDPKKYEEFKELILSIQIPESTRWTSVRTAKSRKGDLLLSIDRVREAVACYHEALNVNTTPKTMSRICSHFAAQLEKKGHFASALIFARKAHDWFPTDSSQNRLNILSKKKQKDR